MVNRYYSNDSEEGRKYVSTRKIIEKCSDYEYGFTIRKYIRSKVWKEH